MTTKELIIEVLHDWIRSYIHAAEDHTEEDQQMFQQVKQLLFKIERS